jgi:REP element-mobilizing transposase RayT
MTAVGAHRAPLKTGGHRPPLQPKYKGLTMPKSFKPRLQRLKTLFTDCPVCYLTICTQDRRRFLANPQIHESFQTFARNATDWQVFVGRYVIMPDHVHFFAGFTPLSPSLDRWIKSWKNALSKTLRGMNIPPRHFEKDFFDHVMRSEESYEQKWLYVRENPVRAGLVKRWEDWPYQGEIHPLAVAAVYDRPRRS